MRERLLPPIVAAVLVLGAAELLIRWQDVDPALLAPPSAVAQAFWDDRSTIASATRVTLEEILVGLVLAVLVGLVASLAMHRWRSVRRGLHPWLVASQAVPTVVIAPVLALLLGYSLSTRAVVVALVAFFPFTVATADALGRADRELLDLYRSLGASRRRTLLDVEAPSALPASFSGLRVAAAFAVVGAVFGEWVGASNGLGYLILTATNRLDTALALACVVVLALLALALVGSIALAERLLTPWRAA